ncbi:MAG: hypothetical protein ACQCN5_14150 [Candidatus Bathyarchaeia archaeon]|jgi:ribonuclease HIII
MSTIGDYVSRIEGTCGAESDVIVVLKFDKKDQALQKIKEKATLKNEVAGMIYDFSFQENLFRFYASGKIIFRGIKTKQALNELLAALLL